MENINKIQIVPDEVYEVGADKVNVIPEWSVKDDSTLYEKVRKLRHSTFDASKFTKVGSPTITDDGIVSGFSTSNYLKTPSAIDLTSTNWEIGIKFTTGTISEQTILNLGSWAALNIHNGYLTFTDGASPQHSMNINPVQVNSLYELKIGCDGTNYYIKYKLNGVEQTEVTQAASVSLNNAVITFGYHPNAQQTFLGSIDLKGVDIIVDGIPVFSGNKTGIDTIKPNNYETGTFGTPVVSSTGILTGGNVVSAITTPTLKLRYEGEIYISDDYTAAGPYPMINIGGVYISLNLEYRNVGFFGGDYWIGRYSFEYNKTYAFVVDTDGTTVDLYWGLKGSTLTKHTYTPASSVTFTTDVSIGVGLNNMGSSYMDLNTIKAFVNGRLVYQPCLRIPYTEAELNQKVVDVKYRDRVKDLFEQVGYNGYHTIDEANKNFTLPTHKFSDVIDMYENGLNKWEQRVDRTVRQQGSCTSGTEVTLLKPYPDDEDYALSVPYSAKSGTAFTPSASGEWFAEGKVVL